MAKGFVCFREPLKQVFQLHTIILLTLDRVNRGAWIDCDGIYIVPSKLSCFYSMPAGSLSSFNTANNIQVVYLY